MDPEQADYVWKDGHYARASGGMKDVAAFSVLSVRGKRLHHSEHARQAAKHKIEYAVMHKLLDGVFHVRADRRRRRERSRARGQLP